MNEVTPDLIAQIATRLYNEIPGCKPHPENGGGGVACRIRGSRLAGRFCRDSRIREFLARCPGERQRQILLRPAPLPNPPPTA